MGYKVWITSAAYRFGRHKSNERLHWEISLDEANEGALPFPGMAISIVRVMARADDGLSR
jgi:hypothetical protein